MPSKTNTDKIDDLSKLLATLTERMDNIRRDTEGFAELPAKVAVLEQQVADLRTKADQASRRQVSIYSAIAGAVVGGILTFIGQLIIKHFWP